LAIELIPPSNIRTWRRLAIVMRKSTAAAGSAVFFAVAPLTVAGLVPGLITRWQASTPAGRFVPVRAIGATIVISASGVLLHAFWRFISEGSGTPAPVAPTEVLVAGGAYRYVRNPMYLAVVSVIVGQALLLLNVALLGYALAVLITTAAFARFYEEPVLHATFGASYDIYRRTVPGWLPRLRPPPSDRSSTRHEAQLGLPSGRHERSRWVVLAVLCLAVFTINTDTTIVNVALPSLVRQLGASTRELQWIVDAYNLCFAALVLAAGSLADRYGRKIVLLIGLTLFGGSSTIGAFSSTTTQLIAARAAMGIGAALIFPATLSILSNIFTDRKARAQAIGIWGASTGLGVAFGPITGGWLLEHAWWGSCFLIMGPVALIAIGLTIMLVPTSRDPDTPRLDLAGLILSTAMIGTLVYTIIEAPDRGWTSSRTLVGFAAAALLLVGFVTFERQLRQPMLDVRLFRNLRFSAASGSIAVAFFALFGFIFLITQYLQFVKGYTPLNTGVRLLPVAGSLAAASIIGTKLAVTIGNKTVIAGGLGLLGVVYLWISTVSAATTYPEIVAQMLLLGTGMGLTSTPATEAILGAVSKDKAGIGSAVNDATRELGGTLGVAVIGSVFTSLYIHHVQANRLPGVPNPAITAARNGIGAAYLAADRLTATGTPSDAANNLLAVARAGFFQGLHAGCLVAAGVAASGALFAALVLPNHPASAFPLKPTATSVLPPELSGGEVELAFVETEMLRWVPKEIPDRHGLGKERVPTRREAHHPIEGTVASALDATFPPSDDPLTQAPNTGRTQNGRS
jgi:EmrB/QacA subfamily drug resistance transporter